MAEKREPLERAEIRIQEMGRELKKMLPKGWHFVIILASQGEKGFSTYISTIERKSAVSLMKETAEQIEKKGFIFDV